MPTPPDSFARRRPPPRWLEWAVLSLVAATLVLALEGSGLLRRVNWLIQDALIALQTRSVAGSEVVIVGIDDKSVAALGRWPWRRSFHAALIDAIGKDGPRAIGMDVLFSEPDQRFADDDAAMAGALARSGRVVLPRMMQNIGGKPVVVEPIPVLAREARALGLVHLPVDDDGIARNVYLREGLAGRLQDHFSVAMLAAAGEAVAPADLPGLPDVEIRMEDPISDQSLPWQRAHKMVVPFAGPPGHFRQVSYVDVLDGKVPPGTFRNKFVLIGATAAGLGDLYATPVSGRPQLMSGVEVSANVLDSLLTGHSIAVMPAWLNAALNLLAVLLALAGLAFLGPLPALLSTVALIAALPAAAAVGMLFFRLEFAPAAGMLGLGLTYALWSWRRLDAATRYLVDELRHLRASGGMVPIPAGQAAPRGDFLDRRMQALRQAARQLRDLHQFVSDSLEGLPDAVVVCDREGTVLLANAAAARHFGVESDASLRGARLAVLMGEVLSQQDHQPVVTAESLAVQSGVRSAAARDSHGRDLLVKQVPSFSGGGAHSGWILSIVDVSALRQAQRQRDDAMRFLGHDLRAPQSSILTLLTLRRQNPSAMTDAQFLQRLERHATKAMALSDDFVQLVRAQSSGYRLESCDLVDLLLECIDDAWETTRRRKLRIVMAPSPPEARSAIDRELVARAIGNLLGNALKFSREGALVTCGVEAHEADWAVLVEDEGPGIAEELRAQLFEPFVRGRGGRHVDGAGLGLAFVKTVALRHGGRVLLDSTPGRGSAFRLLLPRAQVALDAACDATLPAPGSLCSTSRPKASNAIAGPSSDRTLGRPLSFSNSTGPEHCAFDAAIVDLDGTMVDTVGDFVAALNRMLDDLGLPHVDAATVGTMVGKGSEHLIHSVLRKVAAPGADAALYERAFERYQHHYLAVNGHHSTRYAGVAEGLSALRAKGLRLACLTNKPTAFARPLLAAKGLDGFFDHVFGGDAFAHKKPDPLPLVKTCEALGSRPARTLMVGDSSNDARAARAAGCPVVLVSYGYNHGEPVRGVDADGFVDSLAELDGLSLFRAARP